MDVYLTEFHPVYQVWVNGEVYETFVMRHGAPLTWSQQWDVASGYKEGLTALRQSDTI
jgi:hypothetical protein